MCHFLLSFMFYGGYDSCMSQLMMGVICKHGPPRQRTCLFEVCWAQGAVQPWLCGDEYQQHLGKKYGFGPWGPGGGSWGDVYICFRGNDHGSDRYLVIKFARFAGRLHILHTSNPMKLAFSGAQIDDIWLTREKSPIFCLFLPQAGHLSRRLHAWISGRLGGGLRARPTGAAALQL